jgi:predicted PurR-regulated permease PerM
MPKKIEISHRTILFTLGVIVGAWLLFQVRDIIYLLIISFILMTVIHPAVDALHKYKIPRVLAILLVYVVIIGGFALIIASLIPSIASQSSGLIQNLPVYAERVIPMLNIDIHAISQEIAPYTQNILKFGVEIFNNIVNVLTILVFTFYFLLARNNMNDWVKTMVNEHIAIRISNVMDDIEVRIGAWARGQIILMLIIGIMVYIGLTLFGIDYALPLAVFAGLLEVVPMIGPIVSAVPAVLVAFTISPLHALFVAILYFIIQLLENHLIVPIVMKKSVGFSPIVIILAFLIGTRFGGPVGAILALPVILVIPVIIQHFIAYRNENPSKEE